MPTASPQPENQTLAELCGRGRPRSVILRLFQEGTVRGLLVGCAMFSILITTLIIGILAYETARFLQDVSVVDFLTGLEWNPLLGADRHFGIWPLIVGTLLVTLVAAVFALPIGLVTAIFLSEYAPPWLRAILKPILEVLAGIPTVVYGFFALINATVSASTCAGSTNFDTSVKVVVPAALSGIMASYLLAITRAVGETMIVALAAGGLAQMTVLPWEQVQTMTAYMVQIFLGDAPATGVEYKSSFAVAGVLFLMTFLLTFAGYRILLRFREEYE
ncbi:MAG: phosphate ABC transporter permease subunit PstC [Phycisphaerales bacterium]